MTSPAPDLHVVTVEQTDPRLGRHVVHDPRSRRFAFPVSAVTPTRDIQLRSYGPKPLPEQVIGCCTGVDQAVKGNVVGNRVFGEVLDMDDAVRIYSRATELDPWSESYPPDDTGSSGLAACKAAVEQGDVERYEWLFGGVDQIAAALMTGLPVGVGTWWYQSMFDVDPDTGLIEMGGRKAGGHQWSITGYRKYYDAFVGVCWWGPTWGINGTGRFLIRRRDLADLLADDGDVHVAYRKMSEGSTTRYHGVMSARTSSHDHAVSWSPHVTQPHHRPSRRRRKTCLSSTTRAPIGGSSSLIGERQQLVEHGHRRGGVRHAPAGLRLTRPFRARPARATAGVAEHDHHDHLVVRGRVRTAVPALVVDVHVDDVERANVPVLLELPTRPVM